MQYISVTEYAQQAGITRQSVLARIKRGSLKATKIGKYYAIRVDADDRTHKQTK